MHTAIDLYFTSQRIILLCLLLCKNISLLFSVPNFKNSDHPVSLVKKVVIDASTCATLQRQSSSMLEGYLWQAFGCWCSQVRFPLKTSGCYTIKSLSLHSLNCEWTAIDSNLTGCQARKIPLYCWIFLIQVLAVWLSGLRKISSAVLNSVHNLILTGLAGKIYRTLTLELPKSKSSDRMS